MNNNLQENLVTEEVTLIELQDIHTRDFFNVLQLLKVADYYYEHLGSPQHIPYLRINVQPIGGEAKEVAIPQEAAIHVLSYLIRYSNTYLEELQEDCGVTLNKINGKDI